MAKIGEVEEREEGVFEWTVRDFMSLPDQVDDRYDSPPFSFGGARWCLQVYPNGQRNKSDGFIGIYLTRRTPGPPMELKYSLGLKTTNNEIAQERQDTPNFENTQDAYGIRFRRSILLEGQSKLAPSGQLTIVCRIKVDPSSKTARDCSAPGSSMKSKIQYFETIAPK